MSATLLGAITSLFDADPTLPTECPGSPWLDEAREGTNLPLVVVTDFHESDEPITFEDQKKIVSRWTFLVHAVGEANAETIAGQLLILFDDTNAPVPLAVARRNLIQVILTDYRVSLNKTRSTSTQRVTEARLEFMAEWTYG